jgi:hypothetical protein
MSAQMIVLDQVKNARDYWEQVSPLRWEPVPVGTPMRFGRDSAVTIGAAPEDRRVSGRAVEVVLDGDRWRITATNRHGVDLYRWGQPPTAMIVGETESVVWPRVALYVRGTESTFRHWIVCDDPGMPITAGSGRTTTDTERGTVPPPLTGKELQAVWAVFEDTLAWPPRNPIRTRTFRDASALLHISEAGVRGRLDGVRGKATALGLPGTGLDDPTYVHTLVRHGFITPDPSDMDKPLRTARYG